MSAGRDRRLRPPHGTQLNQLVWRRSSKLDLVWRVEGATEARSFWYEMRLPGADLNRDSSAEDRLEESFSSEELRYLIMELANALKTTQPYKLVPDEMRKSVAPERQPVLSSTGDNLATVLEALMTGSDPPRDLRPSPRIYGTPFPLAKSFFRFKGR